MLSRTLFSRDLVTGAALSPGAQLRAPVLAALAAIAVMALALVSPSAGPTPAVTEDQARESYGKLPLSFVPNRGQTDKRVRYYAQAPGSAST